MYNKLLHISINRDTLILLTYLIIDRNTFMRKSWYIIFINCLQDKEKSLWIFYYLKISFLENIYGEYKWKYKGCWKLS